MSIYINIYDMHFNPPALCANPSGLDLHTSTIKDYFLFIRV